MFKTFLTDIIACFILIYLPNPIKVDEDRETLRLIPIFLDRIAQPRSPILFLPE